MADRQAARMWGARCQIAGMMLATSLARLWQSGRHSNSRPSAYRLKPARHVIRSRLPTSFALQDDSRGKLFSLVALRQGVSTFQSARACEAGARASLFSRLGE